jgi:hypothetical protein
VLSLIVLPLYYADAARCLVTDAIQRIQDIMMNPVSFKRIDHVSLTVLDIDAAVAPRYSGRAAYSINFRRR